MTGVVGQSVGVDRGAGHQDAATLVEDVRRRIHPDDVVGAAIRVAAVDASRRLGQRREASVGDRRAETVVR
jgi:hypothetical protein